METKATDEYSKYLTLAIELAQKAGDMIYEAFQKPKNVTSKSSAIDIVTETDKACEALIIDSIHKLYPTHKFIAEESHTGEGYDFTDEPTWLIDPVDGTTNFVHSFPFVCVSIGLAIKKQVVVGVVHNPIMKETFTAVLHKGAFLNGMPIHVSGIKEMNRASCCIEFGYDRTETGVEEQLSKIRNLLRLNVQALRSVGSAALSMCGVACGRADLYFEGKNSKVGIKPWDIAAGSLIVCEAGGVCFDVSGQALDLTNGRVLCGNNSTLVQALIKAIN